MLKKLAADEVQAQLAVADSKLGGIIRDCEFRVETSRTRWSRRAVLFRDTFEITQK